MKTDIQIAQEAQMIPITEVAAPYGISGDDLELYGKYKAKLSDELWEEVKDRPDGKLVLVTAINPCLLYTSQDLGTFRFVQYSGIPRGYDWLRRPTANTIRATWTLRTLIYLLAPDIMIRSPPGI